MAQLESIAEETIVETEHSIEAPPTPAFEPQPPVSAIRPFTYRAPVDPTTPASTFDRRTTGIRRR